jgi:hypothetical protein
MTGENFLRKYDSWRAFAAPLGVLLFLEILDVVLTAWVTGHVPHIHEGNALLADPLTGQFLVWRAFEVKAIGLSLVLGSVSLGAYLGTRSWLLASLPLYYGIATSAGVLFDNLAVLFFT